MHIIKLPNKYNKLLEPNQLQNSNVIKQNNIIKNKSILEIEHMSFITKLIIKKNKLHL